MTKLFEGVIPALADGSALNSDLAMKLGYESLAAWMTAAERIWDLNKQEATTGSLIDQFNFFGKLAAQFPIPAVRIVYSKAGALPAACVVEDLRAIIDTSLYWYAPRSLIEARFLAAILNSETARSRAAQYQARGQFGARLTCSPRSLPV